MRVASTIGATRAAAAASTIANPHALRAEAALGGGDAREGCCARAGVDHEQGQMREGVGDVTFGGGAAAAAGAAGGAAGESAAEERGGERRAQVGGAAEDSDV